MKSILAKGVYQSNLRYKWTGLLFDVDELVILVSEELNLVETNIQNFRRLLVAIANAPIG